MILVLMTNPVQNACLCLICTGTFSFGLVLIQIKIKIKSIILNFISLTPFRDVDSIIIF